MAVVKKHVSEEALRTSKRVVVIGETGAGKSAFCGLLEGSLEFVDGHWTSTFKLGHGSSSETNEPKLLAAQWRVRDDVLPILLLDTPGLGDSRGPQKDDEHMAEVARWVNGLGHVHAMVILLKNETRISHSLRENLQFFQRRFGKKMWDHTLMVVNKWSHETKAQKKRKAGKLQSAKQFEEEFRQMLQQDASGDGEDSDLGVGLSKERAEKVPFFFVDTHYDRDDEDEVKSMENELREMKRWLRSLLEWKVGANSQKSSRTSSMPSRPQGWRSLLRRPCRPP
jgi:energy-coupling factor transporter ATP-binding protein EcfA2